MGKYRVMADGSRVGTMLTRGSGGSGGGSAEDIDQSVSGSVGVLSTEVDTIKKILKKVPNTEIVKGELSVNVRGRGKSVVRLTLRQDSRDKKMWYLNMDGNPLTFLTGKNVYGWPNADAQIVAVFMSVLKAIEDETEKKFPQRVKDEIVARRIHLNMLEFAAYTPKLKDKKRILNSWSWMFRRANFLPENDYYQSLEEMLNVHVYSTPNRSTFAIAMLTKQRTKEVLFSAYDKEEEIKEKQQHAGEATEYHVKAKEWKGAKKYRDEELIPDDIKSRLRLEIGFTSVWFNRRRIRTLADLVTYVGRRHGGDWIALVSEETKRVMEQACLIDMWTIDKQAVLDAADKDEPTVKGLNPRIPTEAWLAMLEARTDFGMKKAMMIAKLDPERRADYLTWLDREASTLSMKEVEKLRVTTNVKVATEKVGT